MTTKTQGRRPAARTAPIAARASDRTDSEENIEKLSREHRPESMTLETWQIELRRQFGRDQPFLLRNVGGNPYVSDFLVANPATKRTYRVTIRGLATGMNACTCPDFATNTLGTCKHIEFTLGRLCRTRPGKAALTHPAPQAHSEVVLRYGPRRTVHWLPGSECPSELRTLANRYFDVEGSLREEAFAHIERFLASAGRFKHEIRCRDEALEFVAEVRDAAERMRRIDAAFPRGPRSAALDGIVKTKLYDYQREGAIFAARAGRCVLGDDMGLGKTVQAIAAAEIMARHLGVARVLVVCPTSLKHQWEREVARFTGRTALTVNGLRARRETAYRTESFLKITNYDTIHADLDLITAWNPDLVVLDEAQRIKNWSTRTARSVKRIASPYAIVLTGTPLENRLEELVSIVEFVDRFRLGPTFRLLDRHQKRDEDGRVVGYQRLDELGRTLEPILLRRRKSDVLKQLPERIEQRIFVEMTPQQMRHHDEGREIVARIALRWKHLRYLSEADRRRLLVALQLMRMSCDSTYLIDETSDHGRKADELMTLLGEALERPEQKVVVFSQWKRMLDTIAPRLEKKHIGHVLFCGDVPGSKRGALVERFREDPDCRVFLSTDAGGVGLNLQHASMVVNLDMPWNPAVLEQRIGRVHRLGQQRPVHVVDFVSHGTIEESMLSVLSFKSSLFAGVLDDGAKDVFLGGTKLQRFMRTVEEATNAIGTVEANEATVAGETEETRSASTPTHADEAFAKDESSPVEPSTRAAPADAAASAAASDATLLAELARALAGNGSTATGRTSSPLLTIDPGTGESLLRIPAEAKPALAQVFRALAEALSAT
jgi:superfamily II DNA or RNA helicase